MIFFDLFTKKKAARGQITTSAAADAAAVYPADSDMTAEEAALLERAQLRYRDAQTLIRELCTVRYCDHGEKFKTMDGHFQEIVQAVLLASAMDGGELHPAECRFLQHFPGHDLFLTMLNRQSRREKADSEELSLAQLHLLDDAQRSDITALIRGSLSMHAQSLYEAFADADYAVPGKDYLGELKAVVADIVMLFSEVDGDRQDSAHARQQQAMGLTLFYEIFERYWRSHKKVTYSREMRRP